MKLTIQHFQVKSTDQLDSFIEERIFDLEARVEIEEARIRLECSWQDSPPFRVTIHLVTPGPDLVAEGKDHTLQAALEKVLNEIDEKIEQRGRKHRRRLRSDPQFAAHGRARSPLRAF